MDFSLFGLQVVRSTSSQVNLFVPRPPYFITASLERREHKKLIPMKKIILFSTIVLAFISCSKKNNTASSSGSSGNNSTSNSPKDSLLITLDTKFNNTSIYDSISYGIAVPPAITENGNTRLLHKEWRGTIKNGSSVYQLQAFQTSTGGNLDSLSLKVYIKGNLVQQKSGYNSISIYFTY